MLPISYYIIIFLIIIVCYLGKTCYQLTKLLLKERQEHEKQIKDMSWKYDSNLKLMKKTFREKVSLLKKKQKVST